MKQAANIDAPPPNTARFLPTLLDEASRPFRNGGHFAYHYARGKLSSDCIFRE